MSILQLWPQPKRRHPEQLDRHRGFTLLELLVVVVVVSILFTYATLAIRSDTPEDLLKEEARRLDRLVELALEEAILRGEEYALEVHQNGYLFLRFYQDQWQPLADDKILRERELPLNMELEMRLEETEIVIDPSAGKKTSSSDESNGDSDGEQDEENEDEASYKPQIFLLSSGEITPEFDIRFYILGVEKSYIVKGLFDGSLTSEASDL